MGKAQAAPTGVDKLEAEGLQAGLDWYGTNENSDAPLFLAGQQMTTSDSEFDEEDGGGEFEDDEEGSDGGGTHRGGGHGAGGGLPGGGVQARLVEQEAYIAELEDQNLRCVLCCVGWWVLCRSVGAACWVLVKDCWCALQHRTLRRRLTGVQNWAHHPSVCLTPVALPPAPLRAVRPCCRLREQLEMAQQEVAELRGQRAPADSEEGYAEHSEGSLPGDLSVMQHHLQQQQQHSGQQHSHR